MAPLSRPESDKDHRARQCPSIQLDRTYMSYMLRVWSNREQEGSKTRSGSTGVLGGQRTYHREQLGEPGEVGPAAP